MTRLIKLCVSSVLALPFALSACSNTTASVPSENSAEHVQSNATNMPWTEAQTEQEAHLDGSRVVATDFVVTSQKDYSQIVVEFTGTSTPGWETNWVQAPASQGSGAPLDVDGTVFLDVILTGTNWPSESGEPEKYYSGEIYQSVDNIDAVFDGTYENNTRIVIGMDGKHPYRISTLDDPSRVVIDVLH